MKNQTSHIYQKKEPNFDDVKDQMDGNNVEVHEGTIALENGLDSFESNSKVSTKNNSGVNPQLEEESKIQTNEIKPDSEPKEEKEVFSRQENQQNQNNHQNSNSPKSKNESCQIKEIERNVSRKKYKNFMTKAEYAQLINKQKSTIQDSSNNLMNSISNNPQTYIQANLIDTIRFAENKIIAIYKEINGNNLYVFEYTIGNNPYAYVDWFFPNRAYAYSYVYNYISQNMYYGRYI